MMNYRWGGYLLIALGLINLRYQTGHSNVLAHSLVIVIPGALILAATWTKSLAATLDKKSVKSASIVIGLILIAYSLLN
jgi:hypothetical protein